MSVNNSHKSQFNSSGTSNCEKNTSDVKNSNNFQDKDEKESSKLYDDGEMYFTDSEEEFSPVSSIISHYKSAKSTMKYAKQINKHLEYSNGSNISYIPHFSMSSEISEITDTYHEEPKQHSFTNVPSTISSPGPYKKRKIIYSHKVNHTPERHLPNKSNAPRYISTNAKKQVNTPKQRSQMSFNNVTNILNTNPVAQLSPVVRFQKPNSIKNKQNAKNTIKKRIKFDKNDSNITGFSEIVQSEICLKMFPVKTVLQDFNCLKHDLMNKMSMNKRSNLLKHFNRNICAIMKSEKDTDQNETNQSILPLVDIDQNIDFDSLNVLNDKLTELELVNKTFFTSKCKLNDKQKGKNSVENLDGHDSNIDFEMNHRSDNFSDSNILPPERAADEYVLDDTNAGNDSFDDIRELVTSSASLPFADNDVASNSSSEDLLIENNSLRRVDENDITAFSAIASAVSMEQLCLNDSSIISEMNSTDREGQDVLKTNRYNLRKRPRSTDHYFAPFGPSSLRAKKKRSNKYNKNDMFFLGGTARNKVIYRYKVHTSSIELLKKICPANNRNQPKSKPCPCGIFPSQVPSLWNSSLHDSLHRSLHKLQFNGKITPKDVVNKCNSNGYIYNIIKITTDCDVDKHLELTLKNVKDFINTELEFSDNSIRNLNHAIYLAVNLDSKIIGYLEVEPLNRACIYQNDKSSLDYVAVKFGVSKLWVMVSYRNNGVATRLLKQFRDEENLETNDIAFSYHRRHGMPFIKKFFANNSTLVY